MKPLNSDRALHCMTNLDAGHAAGYPADWWASSPLVTDLAVHTHDVANPPGMLDRALRILSLRSPDAPVGTYISGGQVRPKASMLSYPPECIEADSVPSAWRVRNSPYINLSKRASARTFACFIVRAVVPRKRPWVFLDNIVHPSANAAWFSWRDTCAYLAALKANLEANNMRFVANIAVAPFAMSDVDVKLLTKSVDGMSFEMPFTPDARGDQAKTQRLISVYRRWLDAGKVVVLIPVDPEVGYYTDDEARLIAALAMMVRKPGDALFVTHLLWKPVPEWSSWPQTLGEPLADYAMSADGRLSRIFSGGTLRVDVAARRVIITKKGDL